MELLQFNQHCHQPSVAKPSKVKSKTRSPQSSSSSSSNNRFVGVRQRPSGRWVAEIKDTTQKIRMWLWTFETAEEAARAYDEAACLLRGSNTRTNFNSHYSTANSAMASRIRNLLHHKKQKRSGLAPPPPPVTCAPTFSAASCSLSSAGYRSTFTAADAASPFSDDKKLNESQMVQEEEVLYRPCFGAIEAQELDHHLQTSSSWMYDSSSSSSSTGAGLDYCLPLMEHALLPEAPSAAESEFERMKVERQISASLYAMNGVQEYLDTVHDASDPLWDLPPLYHLCRSS